MRKDVTIRDAAGGLRTVPVELTVGGDEPDLRASLERVVNAALVGYRAANGDRVHHTRELVAPAGPPQTPACPTRDDDHGDDDKHL